MVQSLDGSKKKVAEMLTLKTVNAGDSCCESGSTSCCDNSGNDLLATRSSEQMFVTIDGQKIEVLPEDKNIVDVASRVSIAIPAACYRAKRSKGCCHGCVIEVDGEQKYACVTVPANGMSIVVDRADLKALRKQNLTEYKEGIESGNHCKCSLSDSGSC